MKSEKMRSSRFFSYIGEAAKCFSGKLYWLSAEHRRDLHNHLNYGMLTYKTFA